MCGILLKLQQRGIMMKDLFYDDSKSANLFTICIHFQFKHSSSRYLAHNFFFWSIFLAAPSYVKVFYSNLNPSRYSSITISKGSYVNSTDDDVIPDLVSQAYEEEENIIVPNKVRPY